MSNMTNEDTLLQVETTCGTLLYELQIIWNEVGESEEERDKMLLDLERECLEVYRRKVDLANRSRAQLRQAIADSEAELAAICSAMGERPVHIRQTDHNLENLKEEVRAILPQLEEMRKRKYMRRNQFIEIAEKIQQLSNEIHSSSSTSLLDESDLSLRRLEELQKDLHVLQKEKSDRLMHVADLLNSLNSLCVVIGADFIPTAVEVDPSFGYVDEGGRNISDEAIGRLTTAIHMIREIKIQRMQQLQEFASTILELWNLMDTPVEEQLDFQNVTTHIAASEEEITEANMLSLDYINIVEAEVRRLEEMKGSKMKELVMKKRTELEEMCRKMHLVPESSASMDGMMMIEGIESGRIDAGVVLEEIEMEISNAKEEWLCRKEIVEKVDKWVLGCEEECWLEEYNQDENRYNGGRGGHLTLKRAEKARALVNKLPGMVETIVSKTRAWENERGMDFNYDGIRLIYMLEEYTILREEKEQERKRQRDKKKVQGQLITEKEAMFGSKPSPMKQQSGKKAPRLSMGGGQIGINNNRRRISLGGATLQQTQKTAIATNNPNKSHLLLCHANANAKNKKNGVHQKDDHHDDDHCGYDDSLFLVPINSSRDEPISRKPFSLISSKTNVIQEFNNSSSIRKQIPEKTTSPSKVMMIPVDPSTPLPVAVPMQTHMTPAAPLHFNLNPNPNPNPTPPFVKEEEEASIIEYSFEERRLGFVLPPSSRTTTTTYIKPFILQAAANSSALLLTQA